MYGTIPTPEGTRDQLFGECKDRRNVQSTLLNIFGQRGFCEVSTPEVEFYDLFLRSGNPIPQEQMLKIIDRSGKIMVMRPDSTAPIARMAAAKLQGRPMPQRLYYDQTVFRSGLAHKGGRSEIAQCGVELLGASGLRADVEILALAADVLRACGLNGFHIEVGHVGFFQDLTASLSMGEEETEHIRSLIEKKNFAALGDRLAPYSDTVAGQMLLRLPYLFGGLEVLDEAEALFPQNEAISYLRELYGELAQAEYGDCIRFDLGLVHQIEYYSGVIFRGYTPGAADSVLSGGRYDHLLGAFGAEAPATGFAIDVDAVCGCLKPSETEKISTIIHYERGFFKEALAVLGMEKAGQAELSTRETEEESRRLAEEKGAKRLLIVRAGGTVEEVAL